ncbi:MAG: lytic transglycosylase domain-containing protein [Magnetococcales bacterium]|nr:lytic transglycosylase domain-containing protein [Magnetococcales bacterium]
MGALQSMGSLQETQAFTSISPLMAGHQTSAAPGLAKLSELEMAWLNEGLDRMAAVSAPTIPAAPAAPRAPGLAELSPDEKTWLSAETRLFARTPDAESRTTIATRQGPVEAGPGNSAAQMFRQRSVKPAATPAATPRASGKSYEGLIQRAADRYGLDKNLLRAVIQTESSFNPKAVSRVGAQGLMQLMPDTAKDMGVANPLDPEQNVMGGAAYLKKLLDRYRGERSLALAAYNWGMGNVERRPDAMPAETRNYIAKISNLMNSAAA